ncbi:MAG TPA: hypothetical protein PKL71_07015, partial [Marmoricola sp.]|nr:hypothetical protein [Marmoricola sp.]
MHLKIAGRFTGPATKWLVALFWLILVAGIGPFAGKLTGVLNNESASWLPESAESTQAMNKLAA